MENLIKSVISVLPKSLQDIYYKYEEKWMYLLFGGLTTVISIISKLIIFALIPGKPVWENTTVVILSWILAVTFAFFTNKKYVFKNVTKTRQEFRKTFVSFYGGRVATLLMEWLIFAICCDWLGFNQTVITFLSQVLIFVANYVISKVFVFRKKDEKIE